jgi:hypothetical protein
LKGAKALPSSFTKNGDLGDIDNVDQYRSQALPFTEKPPVVIPKPVEKVVSAPETPPFGGTGNPNDEGSGRAGFVEALTNNLPNLGDDGGNGGDGGDGGGDGGGGNGGEATGFMDADKTASLVKEMIGLSERQEEFVNRILSGNYTPEELMNYLEDDEYRAVFNHPEWGPMLNPALELAVSNATEHLKIAADLEARGLEAEAAKFAATAAKDAVIAAGDAGATDIGALLRSGATGAKIMEGIRVGLTGLSTDDQVLESQRISSSGGFSDVEDMLTQQRIQASGGLDTTADILAMQSAEAADNAFGSLQLGDVEGSEEGSRLANILSIINAQQSGQTGANSVAREGNFLNFMGNPAAVGAATAAGFDPMGQMKAALQKESDSPAGNVGIESAMKALEIQDPKSGLGNINPDTGLAATSGVGNIGGLGQNFTEGQYDNASNQTQQNVSGQLAVKQGLGSDQIEDRARSYTPGDTSTKRTLV